MELYNNGFYLSPCRLSEKYFWGFDILEILDLRSIASAIAGM